MKVLVCTITLLCFFFFNTSTLFSARNLNISIDKSSLYGEDELVVTVDQTGFAAGETIYIK